MVRRLGAHLDPTRRLHAVAAIVVRPPAIPSVNSEPDARASPRHRLARQRRRVNGPAPRARRLLEAVAQAQQLAFAERRPEERDADRQAVGGEAGRHDQIGKSRQVRDVGRRRRRRRPASRAAPRSGRAAATPSDRRWHRATARQTRLRSPGGSSGSPWSRTERYRKSVIEPLASSRPNIDQRGGFGPAPSARGDVTACGALNQLLPASSDSWHRASSGTRQSAPGTRGSGSRCRTRPSRRAATSESEHRRPSRRPCFMADNRRLDHPIHLAIGAHEVAGNANARALQRIRQRGDCV